MIPGNRRSRIALSVPYSELSPEDRRHVWGNLLGAAKLDPTWADELAMHKLNGREIKHRIRIAQALALDDKRETTLRDMVRAIRIAEGGE